MRELLFCLIVLLSNTVQAATGFAGPMLAMAPSIKLLGADAAKTLLTSLSFLVSVSILARAWKQIDWKQFLRIVICMLAGLGLGMALERLVSLAAILPFYGGFLVAYGLYRLLSRRKIENISFWLGVVVMILAGMLQALFVSGGAMLVIYASVVLADKERFRATLAPVWVLLNAVMIAGFICGENYTPTVLRIGAISLVPLVCGMLLGGYLHKVIKQELFLKICFLLLLINGVWILVG